MTFPRILTRPVLTREQRRALDSENAKHPRHLVEIPRDTWPPELLTLRSVPIRALRSRDFLVQVFPTVSPEVLVRLSVCRTSSTSDGARFVDGIAWDDLQRLKSEAGFGDHDAVEVFPRDRDVVNVANMRHLFVMVDPLGFAWR